MRFINVRGCNGSGKTTLLRALATSPGCEVREFRVHHTTKKEGRCAHAPIPVTLTPEKLAIIGDYTPAKADATTAGCDRIKTQEAAKNVLEAVARALPDHIVLFEGVVISTIYGPWKEWAREHGGMVWAFLDTPLNVCLTRIQQRNGGKPIKEDQVADKFRTLERVREKALNDGLRVADLDYEDPLSSIWRVIRAVREI